MNTRRLVAAAVIATVITSPALAQRAPQQPQHSSNPAYDVYVNGQYVGSDPGSEYPGAAAAPLSGRSVVDAERTGRSVVKPETT